MKAMRPLVMTFAAHPTAANLLMVLFIALGLLTAGDIRRETFPDYASTEVEVTAKYPGATATEVESAVVERIEDALDSIQNLKKVTASAAEGKASVILEMNDNADAVEFLNDVKTEIDAISTFPQEVEDVIVKRINRTDQVLSVAVTGPMSEADLKLFCDQLKEKIRRLPLVSQVDLLGFSEHQLLVEVPYSTLLRLGLTINDIESAIRQQSLDMPVGSIETSKREYLIRFTEQRRDIRELAKVVIVANEQGQETRLGDIATITDRFADPENSIRFNGERAGLLQINKNKNEDALDIMDQVKAFLETEQQRVPEGVALTVTQNVSKIVRDRLTMLSINAGEGLLLVFLTLWLFFNIRMSFWVAMGLPVSFFLTFFLMKQIDFSFNMLSMVGLLIAIGILMDDAIVIAENVAAHLNKGKRGLEAAIDGVTEVASGVWSSFLTTLFIFGALALSMEGDIGKVLYAIPVVLIITLSVSMIEAFCILPNHLAHSLEKANLDKPAFRVKFEQQLQWIRENIVGTLADYALRFRYLFLGMVLFIFLLSIGMIAGGVLKIQAFPDTEGDVLQARILLPQGTPLPVTRATAEKVVAAMQKVNRELTPDQPDNRPLVENFSVTYNVNVDAGESGPHVATVSLDLLNAEERNTSISEITNKWRQNVGVITDAIAITYKEPSVGPGGRAIEIQLQGDDLHTLSQATIRLKTWLSSYSGVHDLADDLRPGKPELRIQLNRGALAMGFTAESIAGQLRAAFYGAVSDEVINNGESYEIMVKVSGKDMDQLRDLSGFFLISSDGEKVPIQSVATIEQDRGFARINRINGVRTVTITGDVDTSMANSREIINDTRDSFFPLLTEEFPDVAIVLEGEAAETRKSMIGMVKAFLIGIFGVFLLLSLQFKNYLEPLVIMAIIPFALIGVIWGHIAMGLTLTMPSIMGFISLAGIVVNDSILLVTFVRNNMARGLSIYDAARQASRDRFRAVLLTSVTTIMGLLPLLSERSMQAQVLIPLACAIVFGLLATTFLVLFVVPSLYAVLADVKLIDSKPAKD